MFKILNTLKFLGLKNVRKIKENFKKIFQKSQKFVGVNNFKRLFISMPKCIELNSKSKSK